MQVTKELVEAYLNHPKRYTINTFLSYTLQGKAKRFQAGYERRMRKVLKEMLNRGEIIPVASIGGGISYIRSREVFE